MSVTDHNPYENMADVAFKRLNELTLDNPDEVDFDSSNFDATDMGVENLSENLSRENFDTHKVSNTMMHEEGNSFMGLMDSQGKPTVDLQKVLKPAIFGGFAKASVCDFIDEMVASGSQMRQALERQIQDLSREVASATSESRLLRRQMEQVEQQRTELEAHKGELEAKQKEAEARIEELTVSLTNSSEESKVSKQQLNELRQHLSETQTQLTDTRQELSATQQELSTTQQELSTTQQELSDTRLQAQQATQELSISRENLAESQQALGQNQELLAHKQEELTQNQKALAKAHEELANTQAELQTTKQLLSDIRQQFSDAQQRFAETQQQLADMQEQLHDARERLAATQGTQTDFEQALQLAQTQKLRDQQQIEELNTKLHEYDGLLVQMDKTTREYAELNKHVQTLSDSCDQLSYQNTALASTNKNLQDEHARLAEAHDLLVSQNNELALICQNLETEVKDLKQQNVALKQVELGVQKQRHELMDELKSSQEACDVLKMRLDALHQENEALKCNLQQSHATQSHFSDAVVHMRSRFEELFDQLSSLVDHRESGEGKAEKVQPMQAEEPEVLSLKSDQADSAQLVSTELDSLEAQRETTSNNSAGEITDAKVAKLTPRVSAREYLQRLHARD